MNVDEDYKSPARGSKNVSDIITIPSSSSASGIYFFQVFFYFILFNTLNGRLIPFTLFIN